MREYNSLLIEISKEGRKAYSLPKLDVDEIKLDEMLDHNMIKKTDLELPELSELDLVRHYTLLSNKNFGVDTGFYPLGSCTMKYNPKINEDMASLSNFTNMHPYQPVETLQGSLKLMYDLSKMLCEITGMDKVTLQPSAGAHGEFTGLMIIRKYHESRGDLKRTKVIVPDSAHGTNPASANMGITRAGDMGFDVVHLNLHKTFAAPHSGGGPGSGPVGVKKDLAKFLPIPVIEKKDDNYYLDYDRKYSIGKIKNFYGNFGVMIRSFAYILTMGRDGLKKASQIAVLNVNYLKENLKEYYDLPIDEICKHEFVLRGPDGDYNTMDIAKRMLDYGYHPPTVYFPLIIHEAMMIEPTETESLETLDKFIGAMITIAKEGEINSQLLTSAPHNTIVSRVDDSRAVKKPILTWKNR